MKGFASVRRLRPGAVVGRLVLGASLGLVGCGTLQDQVSKQGAEVAELRTGLDGLRSDLQGLRQQVAALQATLESADRRSTAEREAGEVRGREIQDVLAQRLATVERRVEELGDGVTGLEVGTAALAEQFARLEAGTVAAVSPPRSRPGARQPGPPISPEELFDRGMESYRAGELGQAVLDFEEFAEKHPGHPLTPSAHFWIGEAYFRSRDFEQAASRYQKAIDLAATGIAHRMPFSAWAWRSGRSIARTGPARSGPGSSGTFRTATRPFGRAPSSASPGGRFARRSLASPGSRPTLRQNGGIGARTLFRPTVRFLDVPRSECI